MFIAHVIRQKNLTGRLKIKMAPFPDMVVRPAKISVFDAHKCIASFNTSGMLCITFLTRLTRKHPIGDK